MNKKILLADDEPALHNLITRFLAEQPYALVHAFDGIEALEKAAQEKPDLILLDIQMPKKDGRQVIQDLRASPELKDIRVIMLTGLGETMDKVAGFELGADDYITKPFDMKVLLRRVKAALEK